MPEQLVYHKFNPNSGKKALFLLESDWKKHFVKLNGKSNIPHEILFGGTDVGITLPPGTVAKIDGKIRIINKPTDLTLKPGDKVSLRFAKGQVIHTLYHMLPAMENNAQLRPAYAPAQVLSL